MAKINVKKLFGKAQDEGEVFLTTLSREELERAGFDCSTFGLFETADIYLQWVGDDFRIKYIFDGDPRQSYVEKTSDVGRDVFGLIIDSYLTRLDNR